MKKRELNDELFDDKKPKKKHMSKKREEPPRFAGRKVGGRRNFAAMGGRR